MAIRVLLIILFLLLIAAGIAMCVIGAGKRKKKRPNFSNGKRKLLSTCEFHRKCNGMGSLSTLRKEIAKTIKMVNDDKKYKNVVIHFRFATSGKTDTDQIHPIQVKKNLYIAHNGVLSGLGDEVESDTQQFAKMLNVLDVDYKKLMEVDKYMKHIIGYNKIVMVVIIIGQQKYIQQRINGEKATSII